jgi:hypothetical protein
VVLRRPGAIARHDGEDDDEDDCCVCLCRPCDARLGCGHRLCRECTGKVFARQGRCPLCRDWIRNVTPPIVSRPSAGAVRIELFRPCPSVAFGIGFTSASDGGPGLVVQHLSRARRRAHAGRLEVGDEVLAVNQFPCPELEILEVLVERISFLELDVRRGRRKKKAHAHVIG